MHLRKALPFMAAMLVTTGLPAKQSLASELDNSLLETYEQIQRSEEERRAFQDRVRNLEETIDRLRLSLLRIDIAIREIEEGRENFDCQVYERTVEIINENLSSNAEFMEQLRMECRSDIIQQSELDQVCAPHLEPLEQEEQRLLSYADSLEPPAGC